MFTEHAIIDQLDIHLPDARVAPRQESFREAKAKFIAQFESTYIQQLLVVYRGNISEAARAAQKDRRTFLRLIRKRGIKAQSFKRQSA